MRRLFLNSTALTAVIALSACALPSQTQQYTESKAGFSGVSESVMKTTGKTTVWVQNQAEAEATAKKVHALVHQKTIGAETAVQVALLNNKGLQAAYAELGVSVADSWLQALPSNPTVSVGVLGVGASGLGGYRTFEAMIASSIAALATQKDRTALSEVEFRQAQSRAAEETLRLANQTRRSWINAVAAFETAGLVKQVEGTADAMSELAARLGQVGSMSKAEQAREHAFFAELSGERAKTLLEAQLAKEELTRALGLWGTEVDYYVPNFLPQLPKRIAANSNIEAKALENRIDLKIAKLELEATAKRYGLTNTTRMASDLEIAFGGEGERSDPGTGIVTERTGRVDLSFTLPIYDSGKASQKAAESSYLQAANIVAQKAVNVRSEARSAYLAYSTNHKIAAHYRDNVLPLRRVIEEQAMLSYNGMITNTFELLTDTSDRLESNILEAKARQDFWLADADLAAATFGGGE
jgi:outer membrane protein TolC